MKTETQAAPASTKSSRKGGAAKGKPALNPIDIPEGAVKEGAKPGAVVNTQTSLAPWQPSEGINLLTQGENAVTHQAFAKYPLALSKTGRFTGKLMNIGDYALAKTGKAFVQSQADRIKAETGKAPDVMSADEKKALSDEMNGLKKQFFQEAKQVVAAINAHPDAQVRRVALRKTASGGMAMTAVTVLERNTISEVEQLRQQLKEVTIQRNELAKNVAPKLAKRIESQAREQVAHDVEATVSQGAAPAPAEGAPAVPASK